MGFPDGVLDDAEILGALEDVRRLLIGRSPADLAQVLSARDAEPWKPYAHLMLLSDHLVALSEGRIPRLIVNMPPRHGKSLLSSVYFPVWYLSKYPDRRVILCSYGDDFAAEWGRKARDTIHAHSDLLGIKVDADTKAANRWGIFGHRGGMKTAGVGGQITGWGAHILIIDDPIKDAAEASSQLIRDQKWEWFCTTALTRREPGAPVAIIQTRWHEDDFPGRIERYFPGEWTVINLPALAEPGDPLGRQVGAALCPERYDERALARIRDEIGTYAFASLYQQRPAPEGGGIFKREDLREYKIDNGFYMLDTGSGIVEVPVTQCWRFVTMDLAITRRTSSDWTVAAVWDVAGYLDPPLLILRHLERHRMEGSGHLQLVRHIWTRWKPAYIGVEQAIHGSLLIEDARRDGILARPLLHRNKDKVFRAKEAAVLLEAHRVFLPAGAPWRTEFDHELLTFPAGSHDDQVDVFSYAASEILTGMNLRPAPREEQHPVTVEDKIWRHLRERETRHRYHPMLGRI